jgi:thioredoxin-related protein
MKKLLIVLFACVSLFGAHVDDYAKSEGFERDYATAVKKAKTSDKPVMMILGADYCPWCRKFERKTISSDMIKNYLDKEIITLVVDKKYDVDTFPKKFQTHATPRVFFINPHTEEKFSEAAGYIKKDDFMKKLESVKSLYKGK